MQRILSGYGELITEALETIGPLANRLRHVDFLTGTDPVFAGLHKENYGDKYQLLAHCCYPWHTTDGSTTIVLPDMREPEVVVHELGHALHEVIQFSRIPSAFVTEYAMVDYRETFAEFFQATFYHYGDRDEYYRDPETIALLERLAKEE